jgi:hypothetical protein
VARRSTPGRRTTRLSPGPRGQASGPRTGVSPSPISLSSRLSSRFLLLERRTRGGVTRYRNGIPMLLYNYHSLGCLTKHSAIACADS